MLQVTGLRELHGISHFNFITHGPRVWWLEGLAYQIGYRHDIFVLLVNLVNRVVLIVLLGLNLVLLLIYLFIVLLL